MGLAQDMNTDEILYILDQLTSASIEISSDPVEITDRHGNVVRTIYNNKTGTFSASSALLSPMLMNAQSGSEAEFAGAGSLAMKFPKIVPVNAATDAQGASVATKYEFGPVDVTGDGTVSVADVKVMGLLGNGANIKLTAGTDYTIAAGEAGKQVLTIAANAGARLEGDVYVDVPVQYVVVYDELVTSGMKISNYANKFPKTIKLKLYVAVMDPCRGGYRAAIVVLPSVTPDPSVTISLDSESTETDFSATINVDYCGKDKALYYIYFLDDDAIVTGLTTDSEGKAKA